MKITILASLITLITLPLSAQQLPADWFTEGSQEKSNDLDSLGSYMDSILTVQESVLEKSEVAMNKSLNGWVLDGQKTDLAVSKSGLLGLAALKATKAVELSWSKVSVEKELEEPQNQEADVILSSEMSEEELLHAVRPSYKILLKNLPEREYSWRAKNFEDHVLRYHRAMKGVSKLNTGKYTPTKFRLDMSVSYSSPLFGFTKLSGDTRLRLEWKIVPSAQKNLGEKDQKVVQKILEDVDEALKNVKVEEGYKLDTLSIGLGLSKKNLLSFSKVKGSIMGHLFLKKNKNKSVGLIPSGDDTYSWQNLSDTTNDKFLGFFKRAKFRKGIIKSFKMTNWFSRQFKGRQSKWVIKKFKTAFTLSYSGFLGLSGTSASSSVSFSFKK